MVKNEEERMNEQASEQNKLEKRMQKIRDEIIETYRKRKKSEKDFLEVVENQKKYWEGQLRNVDPEKDKKRFNELKGKIKNEKTLIQQIKEELENLDKEIESEKRHGKEHKY